MAVPQYNDMIQCLINDDPNEFNHLLSTNPNYTFDPQNRIFTLLNPDIKKFRSLIKIHPSFQTLMHLIAFHDSISVLTSYYEANTSVLQENNFSIFDMPNGEGYLPIHIAMRYGSIKVASFM